MSSEIMVPIYKAIKEEIIDSILSGAYGEGDLIPTQQYYADRYGVSRIVVRRAIDELVRKGVLVTNRGKGTRVGAATSSLFGNKRTSGLSQNVITRDVLSSTVLDLRRGEADKKVASYLCIPAGAEILTIERLRRINNQPYSYERAHLDYSRVASVRLERAALEKGSLYVMLKEQAGLESCYIDEWMRAVLCPAKLTGLLDMQSGDPLLYIRQIAYMADGAPMNYSEIHLKTDIVDVHIRTEESAK